MQIFLGFKITETPYGIVVLCNLIAGKDWMITLTFPRVAYCYVKLKFLGANENAITTQCALPVNMLNERIYLFLWWWILFSAFFTFCSLGSWLVRLLMCDSTPNYMERQLALRVEDIDLDEVRLFATKFVCRDGEFLLRMVGINAGEMLACDVIHVLWERYNQKQGAKTTNRPLPYPTGQSVGLFESEAIQRLSAVAELGIEKNSV